jgi:Bacterial mobilisation protein (MobC)
MSNGSHISTWVSTSTKQRFVAVAKAHEVSESALLKRLVDQVLLIADGKGVTAPRSDGRDIRGARLTVRLEPSDRVLLRERASARQVPASTYVSMLVRSHLRNVAPMPKEELAALRSSINELGAIGRNLNQIARANHESGRLILPARDDLRAMLKACEGLRDHVRALLRSNVASWQSGYAEENDQR